MTTETATRLRVLLADDHHVVRQGLKALLERHDFDVVAEASDGRTAVELTTTLHPDVVVLDLAMPGLNGVDAADAIARVAPSARVILLTALHQVQFVSAALKAGVRGFVSKGQDIDDLITGIREVFDGALYVSPGVSQAVLEAVKGTDGPTALLTPRERQVLQLVGEGRSTREIADLLKISAKTAEFHRGRVMAKLNIHDTAGLVRYAIREGLILP